MLYYFYPEGIIMADTKRTPETEGQTAPEAEVKVADTPTEAPRRKAATPAEDTYTAAEWSPYARQAFKTSAYVIVGATAGNPNNRKYTKSELTTLISQFVNRTAN